ncbi:N(2)-acetyl-L-2,4-diaminobutanoate deacetylase DoeB [Ostreibacterium oceani]|uniref:N-alpha-acetyl diaminobutyric acid deacetylase DoeB n=1 Tax=Ostreibacterium oceani TaxID=2654998 RepID=A0A6N7EY12_9GAMM|nr:N(2)-acetyl-L-2,4-diaminobutanoate deacetylase DoeB [Ostreibacterium oceani]MPV86017.1 N-alpha-acetyl diaminobutyric acid deacetylase DoeB [Ostreibacterium oceani]
MIETSITPTIDFEQSGIQHGFLRLPYSRDDSAWGAVMIPIAQIKNGEGPTALVTGGNHGDEYEGQIALLDFVNTCQLDDIQGTVIVVPAMNYPAAQVGSRVSPIDKGNLNRSFPGNPIGSVTEKIADYFTRYLVPRADYVLDMHSGGKTLDFIPFAACHYLADKAQEARCEAAMQAFGAPYEVKMLEIDATSLYDTAVEEQGKTFVTTELGGAGTTTPETVAIAKRGVANFLRHAGILQTLAEEEQQAPAIRIDMPDNRSYVFAEHEGILEPCVGLGDYVEQGQLVAKVHIGHRTAVLPFEYYAPRDGIVITRNFSSKLKMGDCLLVIGEIVGTSS